MLMHYRLLRTQRLPEYNAIGYDYEHRRSGARVFHLCNDDPENLFAFCFATPPADSTGIAHILEHTVLCGSEHFPLKDPFLQLLKGSVHSFLNAMTFPDRTIYPAASALQRDLFNMMRVYGDAVFRPRLQQEMFMQEGHHTKVNEHGALEISGVVYNEMIGASSTHDHVASEWSYRALLSDTIYGHSSGGEPADIPNLDYQAFADFHRAHYHPSQSFVFLYGNINTQTYLRFLHTQFLRHFQRIDTALPPIASQERWKEPRSIVKTFPYPPNAAIENKSSVTVSWLLDEVRSGHDVIVAEVVSEILIGNSGSPLYKAILDSPLGEDLSSSSGVESELKQLLFSVGIRGTREEHKEQIRTLIYDTLREVVEQGIDPMLLEGTLFKIEFSMREIKSLQGLRVLRRVMPGWLYQSDPYITVSVEQALGALRAQLARDPRYIESVIQHQLIDNPHALTLVVNPDSQQADRDRTALADRLQQREQQMSDQERSALVATHERMIALQRVAEEPKTLARIPRLKVRDMPREPRAISYQEVKEGELSILHIPQHTNDIVYLLYAFDISHLTAHQLTYLPILTTVLTEIGTHRHDYAELSQLINRYFGGLYLSTELHTDMNDPARLRFSLMVRAKTLLSELPRALELLTELLTETDFLQYKRYTQLLTEDINEMKSSIVPSAHIFAGRSAASRLNTIGNMQERWSGVSQLKFLQTISTEQQLDSLQHLYRDIIGHGTLAAVSAQPERLAGLHDDTVALHQSLRAKSSSFAPTTAPAQKPPSRSDAVDGSGMTAQDIPIGPAVYTIPSGGNYVGYALPASRLTTQSISDYVAESVLARTLSTGVLWEQIRMQGGAYGASASMGITPGTLCFVSYRDPHVARTISEFEKALEYAAAGKLTKYEIAQTVVSITGTEITPIPPSQRAQVAVMRHISGRNKQLAREIYRAYLSCSLTEVTAAAVRLREAASNEHSIAIIGEKEAIDAANKARPRSASAATPPLPPMEALPV